MICFTLILAFHLWLTTQPAAPPASDNQIYNQSTFSLQHGVPIDTYCGLHALYGALRILDKQVDAQELVQPKYVSDMGGSTMADLVRAATDFGVYAMPVAGLRVDALRLIDHPTLLHVRDSRSRGPFDHWVLFAGMRGSVAIVVDSFAGLRYLSPAELSLLWDGNALIVSSEPIHTLSQFLRFAWLDMWVLLAVVVATVGLLGAASRKRYGQRRRPIRRCIGMLACATALGVGIQMSDADSLLRNPQAVELAQVRARASFLPTVDAPFIRGIREQTDSPPLLVDARIESDYGAGHMPGARNVSAMWGIASIREELADIPRDRHLIIYCGNRRCRFSRSLAERLLDEGFVHISIYPGGWEEWIAGGGEVSK